MANCSVVLLNDVSLGVLRASPNSFAFNKRGDLCLMLDTEQDQPYTAYLSLSGTNKFAMTFDDLRGGRGAGAPRGVVLHTNRREIEIESVASPGTQPSVGDLVINESGTYILCKHWDEDDDAMALVSPHTGNWDTFYPNSPFALCKSWTLRAFRDSDKVLEVRSGG